MTLFLITAPSGAGKTTLAQRINLWQECISHTTREMRNNEVDGRTYYFIDDEEFNKMQENGDFAETVVYNGKNYGITKEEIEKKTKNKHAFIIVDFLGYNQVKDVYPQAVGIFLHMSKEDCMANMLLRGDNLASALTRIEKYDEEMKNRYHYQYVIKNVRDKQRFTAEMLASLIRQY